MSIFQIDSKTVYENRWMRVREDRILRRDGSTGIFGVVEKPDYTVILAVEGDSLHLVEQYRYPVAGRYWEAPQGSWEQNPDVDAAALARAELHEETGLTAETIVRIGHLFQAYGYSNQGFTVFLASGLTNGPARPELEEQDLVSRAFSFAEVKAMIAGGQMKDATTLAALYLAEVKGFLSLGR